MCRDIPYKHFDYHSECPRGQTKKLDSLIYNLRNQFDEFAFFHYDGLQVTQYVLYILLIAIWCLSALAQ